MSDKTKVPIFDNRKLSRLFLLLAFVILILSIALFIYRKWFYGALGITLHIVFVYVAYRSSGGKSNPAVWENMNLYDVLRETLLLGDGVLGFHSLRNQASIIEKLQEMGLIAGQVTDVRAFVRDRIVTDRRVFEALKNQVLIEMVHQGQVCFWNGYGERMPKSYFHEAEVLIQVETSVEHRFVNVLEGLARASPEKIDGSRDGELRLVVESGTVCRERQQFISVKDVGDAINKINRMRQQQIQSGQKPDLPHRLEINMEGKWQEWRNEDGLNMDELVRNVYYKMTGGASPVFLDARLAERHQATVTFCPYCGAQGVQGLAKCYKCHTHLPTGNTEFKYACSDCGCRVLDDALYCSNCGASLEAEIIGGTNIMDDGVGKKGDDAARLLVEMIVATRLLRMLYDSYTDMMSKFAGVPNQLDEKERKRLVFEITCFAAYLLMHLLHTDLGDKLNLTEENLCNFEKEFLVSLNSYFEGLGTTDISEVSVDFTNEKGLNIGDPLNVYNRVGEYLQLWEKERARSAFAMYLGGAFSPRNLQRGTYMVAELQSKTFIKSIQSIADNVLKKAFRSELDTG